MSFFKTLCTLFSCLSCLYLSNVFIDTKPYQDMEEEYFTALQLEPFTKSELQQLDYERPSKEELPKTSYYHKLTYPVNTKWDCTLDQNLPHPTGSQNKTRRRNLLEKDLGALDLLPLELLQEILSYLDLRSLANFRHANRRATEVVESIPRYKATMTHAGYVIPCILGIETGPWITLGTLYDQICTAKCEKCGDFGGYLYILTCTRVCFYCFTEDKKYLPLLFNDAIRSFGIDRRIIQTLPHMKSIPGEYSTLMKKRERPTKLVDYESA